jgi:cobalt-zinc-cadmium efflux system membrane fusion protein
VAATETAASEENHVHGEWWCSEHGVPEEICAQCDASLVPDFKAKGDWCDEHNRPDSQCFICHPEKEAEFAAQYEAKYGEKPPKPSEAGEEHHDHEHGAEKS